ncbi:MAG: site-specific integrase [Thermodesulfovibrionales bacterium]
MSLYKRKNKYWMDVRINGRRKRLPTGTANRKLAERIHAKVFIDIEEGRWFEMQDRKREFAEMIERYKAEYSQHKDYYQAARDRSVFKHLTAYFGEDSPLDEVAERIGGYEHFRRAKKAKPATIVKELGLLRRMFNIARKQWKWKVSNPVSEIELPRVRNERVRYLSDEERERLQNALDTAKDRWLKPLIVLAMETGLRLSNICNLRWEEVNLPIRTVVISAEKMKNDDYLGIPLTERALNTLRELQKVKSLTGQVFHDQGQPLYPVKVQRAFRKAIKAAAITNFRFHDLRHTFASSLRQKGVDLHTISKLMGHRDTRMTNRYSHLSVESLRSAVATLDGTKWTQSEGAKAAVGL